MNNLLCLFIGLGLGGILAGLIIIGIILFRYYKTIRDYSDYNKL